MNSLKKLLLTKSLIAVAVAASGVSTLAIGQTARTLEPTVLGTPAGGMVCRAGYRTSFDGTKLKCLKNSSVILDLTCDNPRFPTYLARAIVANDNKANKGEDICIFLNSNIGPTDTLNGLTESTNGNNGVWELAKINMNAVPAEVIKASQAEAAALGLPASGVETLQSITFPLLNEKRGIKDQSATQINHHTFATPAGGPVGNPGPVGLQATTNSKSTFVPRPLPR